MDDTKVGHYEILKKLGAWGTGEVYLAQDTRLNRWVAMKFLPESLCCDAEARARLLREAQAASKLSHPNIVTVYAVWARLYRHEIHHGTPPRRACGIIRPEAPRDPAHRFQRLLAQSEKVYR